MVQILEGAPRKRNLLNQLMGGAAGGAGAVAPILKDRQESDLRQRLLSEENSALEGQGYNLRGVNDPKMRQNLLHELSTKQMKQQRNQQENQKLLGESKQVEENYNIIKDAFGEKFANIWKSAPVGGQTDMLKAAFDTLNRGGKIEDLLKGLPSPNQPINKEDKQEIPQSKNGLIPKKYKWEDLSVRPVGYTPKEWNNERREFRKENSPIFQKNKDQLKANIRDELDIKRLGQLNKSKKLPEGLSRALINPETGELWGLAQLGGAATPETQEYSKIFARFQNRAKDTFGTRVTNFDLMSYMKQFPGLLNTPEGRDRILRMMTINNELDQLYEKALNEVYNHYGLSDISQEKADDLAKSFIRDRTTELEDEYLSLDQSNMNESQSEQRQLSGKMIDVIGPDGQPYEVDESEVEMLPEGFRII